MVPGFGVRQRAFEQLAADAAAAERRLDRKGPSISAGVSPMQIGSCLTEPTSSVPIRAVNDRSSR